LKTNWAVVGAKNLIVDGCVFDLGSKTVGYKEIFDWFDYQDGLVSAEGWGPTTPGDGPVTSLERAIELIQRNTRHYAKRQLSYWGRDKDIRWLDV
jgi:tRNA dimethylallyltransferase